ncbi:hypothetical protein C9374_004818 [Naegleria lovaniensis]|uniref:Uncharacterized protein n=1 Tax=Naegleria lovaniensis TaxID=51637 RepID=A0AA88KNQ6_NAELO|nr:uncharacterized protein C9374_004818 [Naegleria lovaniensis]KAG2382851.1 hypothetical protein C9374_004818 [Naegleria lovaniensis]
MPPKTRSQRSREQEILKGVKDNAPYIVDVEDDEDENNDEFNSPLKSTPDKTESDKESTSSVAIHYHRSPTNKFDDLLKSSKKQGEKRPSINMNNTQELSENDDDDEDTSASSKRYDLPEELKHPKLGLSSMLQKSNDTTLSSDSEEENGTTKQIDATPAKKPKITKTTTPVNSNDEYIECALPTASVPRQLVDSSSSSSSTTSKTPAKPSKPTSDTEVISIPSCSLTEIEDTPPKKEEPKKTISAEELDKTFDNPIDSKLNSMRERFDEIKVKAQDSMRHLCDEVLLYLHSQWTLLPENKTRFKKGLEIAGRSAVNNAQKAKLFYLILSYYIIHEKKDIENCIMYLFDPTYEFDSTNSSTKRVDVSLVIELEDVFKEFSNNMEVLSILRKYQALYYICKLQCQSEEDHQTLNTLKSIVKHQHHCMRSYFKSDKKR